MKSSEMDPKWQVHRSLGLWLSIYRDHDLLPYDGNLESESINEVQIFRLVSNAWQNFDG
jgi:hypothetical protein